MATKTSEEIRSELTLLKAQRAGLEQALQQGSLNDSERSDFEVALYNADKEIASFEKALGDIDVKEQKVRKKNNWQTEKPTVDRIIAENHIGYIINEDKFIYCRDFGAGQSNVQFKLVNSARIGRVLNKMSNSVIQGKDHYELVDYFQETGHSFLDVTSSFNKLKWKESDVYNKMSVIRQKWIQPIDDGVAYHSDLDLLIHCVAGGKQENIDHLKQWVAFKYLNPDRNANIPNIDAGGNPGGNGKNTFVTALKTIFTNTCVVQAHKEELEKFNANWEMAVILYYDEPEEKELAAGKLKQATGSEDMRVEKKGIDATMADRNYNFIFMSNNDHGVVKLSGGSSGGEDRRYSVINTNLVLADMYRDAGLTQDQVLDRLNNLTQKIVKDPQEMGRWLAAIIKQYSVAQIGSLPALHGEDYRNRFQDQKDAITEAFDAVVPVFQKQTCMPLSILCDIARAHTGQQRLTDRGVQKSWTQYLKRNKIEVDVNDRVRYKSLWKTDNIKWAQGKVYNTPGIATTDFQWETVVSKKPNYNSVNLPFGKDDLII